MVDRRVPRWIKATLDVTVLPWQPKASACQDGKLEAAAAHRSKKIPQK